MQLCTHLTSVETYLTELFTPNLNCDKHTKTKIGQLALTVFSKMLSAIEQAQMSCFDAHVRDNGCERIALSIYKLIHSEEIKEALALWRESVKDPCQLVQNNENITYLVGCYFLRQIRVISNNQFASKISIIDSFATNISRACKQAIIDKVQSFVSRKSAELMQGEAEQLLNGTKNAERIKEVSLVRNLDFKEEKYFSDSFYVGSLLIYRVQEQQVPVLIKKIGKVGERTFGFLCQSKAKGQDLELMESKLSCKATVFIFEIEANTTKDPQSFRNKFVEQGITHVLLCLSAKTEKKYAADEEVREYVNKCGALKLDPTDNLDHFYCSTLDEENKEGVTIDEHSN